MGLNLCIIGLTEKTICFSSEIKAIIEHPDYKMDVDLSALNEYFSFQNVFSFNTLFKGVSMLPPANTVKIDVSTTFVKHESWWDYDFTQTDENMSFDEATKETKRLFKQAVTRQMIADVPVGSYLSGGMDSGINYSCSLKTCRKACQRLHVVLI